MGHELRRPLDESALFRICFVCTGNICRSPMAEAVFRSSSPRSGYDHAVAVTSAATGDWHVGERADPRTIAALESAGLRRDRAPGAPVRPDWFGDLDLVIAFDRGQERILREWAPERRRPRQGAAADGFDPDGVGHHGRARSVLFGRRPVRHRAHDDRARERALFRQLEPGIRQGVS